MSWSLTRKVSVALLAILFCTMALTAAFGYYKFESVMGGLVQSRYSFVTFTIKKKIEDSLALGFALRQVRQVQEVIEREKVGDIQILSIEVFDQRGEIVFNTDRGSIGSTVPEAWVEALHAAASQGHEFSAAEEDSLIVGLPLVNTLGKVEGGIVLRYPAAYLERELGSLLSRMAVELVAVFAVFAVLAVIAIAMLFRSVTRRLDELHGPLDALAMPAGMAAAPAQAGAEESFDGRFADFIVKTREAVDHITDATQEVERLDRLA